MDRISAGILADFATTFGFTELSDDKVFERLAAYITLRRHYSQDFDPDDIVTGQGGDGGIDAIGIVVNGVLIEDIDHFREIAEPADSLDVSFTFVQATTSNSFSGAKMGSFADGVEEFFKTDPTIKYSPAIESARETMEAIFKNVSKFRGHNPNCRLYYVSTGTWNNDPNLEIRRQTAIDSIKRTNLFDNVSFDCIGNDRLQSLWKIANNSITRKFEFPDRTPISQVAGVIEAHIGFVPKSVFLSIVTNEEGNLIPSIFYENVRDWQGDNPINTQIQETLKSDRKSRFVLMNNGVTIIARDLNVVGNTMHIEDFQVVNGCQTTHSVYRQRDNIDDTVTIPVRIIGTQDEDVRSDIIQATNSQNEVKPAQFHSQSEFAKRIEAYFDTFVGDKKLYYERRDGQYFHQNIEKTRIVNQRSLICAFSGMFLDEAHSTSRNYKNLEAKVGNSIFGEEHRLEPYYAAAYGLYRLDYLFRNGHIDRSRGNAKFHILQAARRLYNDEKLPKMNSYAMEKYANNLLSILWDQKKCDKLLKEALSIIEEAAEENFDRDTIRAQSFTHNVSDLLDELAGK